MQWRSFYETQGRATRTEYWMVMIVTIVTAMVVFGAAEFVFSLGVFTKDTVMYTPLEAVVYFSLSIALVFIALPVSLRRLHDRGRGLGWLLFYTFATLLFDAVDIFSLRFLNLPVLGDDNKNAIYGISGIIGLMSLIDLGFLRGTEATNTYGPDPLIVQTEDPSIFE